MIFSKYILLLTVSYFTGALSSLDCSWDSTTQNIDCPYHTYVDRKTGKLQTVQYTTAPFTRPLSKEDKNTYYKHDDSRKDNNGTASFSYFFNIGGNVPMDDTLKKDGCATTTGSDPNDPLSGPAAGFQKDDNRDFKCHRIAGDITKSENVVVGPIEQDDPAKGFYMTVKGGDDCKDTWRSQSGGYYKRSLTIRVFCDTSSDAVGNVPDVETVREDLTCMCKFHYLMLSVLLLEKIDLCALTFFLLIYLLFFLMFKILWIYIHLMVVLNHVHVLQVVFLAVEMVNLVQRVMGLPVRVCLGQYQLVQMVKLLLVNQHVYVIVMKGGQVQSVIKNVLEMLKQVRRNV
jgi:hypothetical protein